VSTVWLALRCAGVGSEIARLAGAFGVPNRPPHLPLLQQSVPIVAVIITVIAVIITVIAVISTLIAVISTLIAVISTLIAVISLSAYQTVRSTASHDKTHTRPCVPAARMPVCGEESAAAAHARSSVQAPTPFAVLPLKGCAGLDPVNAELFTFRQFCFGVTDGVRTHPSLPSARASPRGDARLFVRELVRLARHSCLASQCGSL
jgi:hypothetical protein